MVTKNPNAYFMSISRKRSYLLVIWYLFIFILWQHAFSVFEQNVTINFTALGDRAKEWLFLPDNSVLFLDFLLFERGLLSQLFCCYAMLRVMEKKMIVCYVNAYLVALNKQKSVHYLMNKQSEPTVSKHKNIVMIQCFLCR